MFSFARLNNVAFAQSYPVKAVRLVVPSGRRQQQRCAGSRPSTAFGQQVFVAKSATDGCMRLIGVNGPIAISPGVYPKVPNDLISDLTAIAMIDSAPNVMSPNEVSAHFKVEIVKWAKVVKAARIEV